MQYIPGLWPRCTAI